MNKNTPLWLLTFVFIFAPCFSQAFLGLHETAEVLPAGRYRVGVVPQFYTGQNPSDFYTGKSGGSDFQGFLDLPVTSDTNARVSIGTGTTDFWAAGSLKWSPYPDYQNQPAIGFRSKVIFVREQSSQFYNLQVAPIISKKYQTAEGLLIPYVGVPVTLIYENSSHNFTAMQMAIGTEWVIQPQFQMGAEFDFDLAKTITTLSVYLNFEFDETKGFRK